MKNNKEYYIDDRPLSEKDPEEYKRMQNLTPKELELELLEAVLDDIKELPLERQEEILEALGNNI